LARARQLDYGPRVGLGLNSGVLALSACLVCAPAIAHAETDRDRAAARAAADAGADAFDQQRYGDAVELFNRAEKLVHATPHLLFIARSLVKLGRLVEAHETYLKIQREKLAPNAPGAFKRAQADAEKEIADVAPRLAYATVRVEGAPSDAVQVLMDDVELPAAVVGIAFPVDPGTHVFRVQAGSDRGEPVSMRFDEGSRHSVALKITLSAKPAGQPDEIEKDDDSGGGVRGGKDSHPPVDRASSKPGNGFLVAGTIVTGIGAVASGVGIYFLAHSSSYRNRADDLFAQCDPTPSRCNEDQRAYIHEQDGLADKEAKKGLYTLIPGGALVATGVALLVVHATRDSAAASPPRTTFLAGPNWVGLSHRF
jgi:hypothetical protein